MAFELPKLDYAYNALEPYIDEKTMTIHHDKHHATYTKNFNDAIAGTNANGKHIEEIFANISKYPLAVRNNGGGYYNHNIYWKNIGTNGETPTGYLLSAIERNFSSFDAFKEEFSKAASTRFGSGWTWLIKKADGKLAVTSTPNQDNPLMDIAEVKGTPLLTIDVWEHAYYLNYQNRRPDYIQAFWNIVKWSEVEARLKNA